MSVAQERRPIFFSRSTSLSHHLSPNTTKFSPNYLRSLIDHIQELFNGQLHQQQPGGHPNALVTPLCDSPRVDLPSIPQTSVNPSPPTTTNHIYPHPYSKYRVYSSSEDDDDLPPRPKVPRTHASSHPHANSRAYSSSEDDDLPPRPRGSRNKANSKPPQVGLDRSPSPPRENSHLVLRDWE